MKIRMFLLTAALLTCLIGCSSKEEPVKNDTSAVEEAAAVDMPEPPTVEDAEPLIAQFAQSVGGLKEFDQFLKTQKGEDADRATVIVESIEIGEYNAAEKFFPVKAILVLAVKSSDGEVKALDDGSVRAEGYPDIPGIWDMSFTPLKNGKWKVGLIK